MKELIEFLAKLRGTYEGLVDEWDIRHAAAEKIEAQQAEIAELKTKLKYSGLAAHAEAAERDALSEQVNQLQEALQLLYSWANNWDSEFMDDPEWKNCDLLIIQEALATGDEK